jgi:hypothetical protein
MRITTFILLLVASACGESSCPAGTTSINGRCESSIIDGTGGSDAGDAGGDGGTSGGSGGTSGTSSGSGGSSGTSGGSGGSGGDSAVITDCDDHPDCSDSLPQCSTEGKCISCSSGIACEGRGDLTQCETDLDSDHRGQCVQCLSDDDCKGSRDGDYCLNNTCVPCKTHSDCATLAKPQCGDDGQCTGCTDSEACEDRVGFEVCVTTQGPERGHCVPCNGTIEVDGGCVEPRCGDEIVTSPEDCDPGAAGSANDTWRCGSGCKARTVYIPCPDSPDPCDTSSSCQTGASGRAQCLPLSGSGLGGAVPDPAEVCPELQGGYVQKLYSNTYCVIECGEASECPPQLRSCIDNPFAGVSAHEAYRYCVPP